MRIANILLYGGALIFAAGCAYSDRQVRYSDSQPYAVTTTTTPAYAPAYSTAEQGAAAAAQVASDVDRALDDSIRRRLNGYPEMASACQSVQVMSRNGIVTLSGTVPSERDRERIEGLVKNVNGVTIVNNDLRVYPLPTGRVYENSQVYATEPPSPPPSAIAATGEMFSLHVQSLTPDDRSLGERILAGLRTDTVLAATFPKVEIFVQNGQIVLHGTVQNEHQRRAILTAIQRASGTGNVRDDLRINRYD